MNMVCWAGNVGQDIFYREIDGFGGCAKFNIAMNQRVRDKEGAWRDGPTTWVRVSAWRLLGEHVRDSVKKGDAVIVYGRVDTRHWVDERGNTHDELTLEATYVGHDLRRGLSSFQRTGRPAAELAPRYETDAEAELALLEAAEEAALKGEAEQVALTGAAEQAS